MLILIKFNLNKNLLTKKFFKIIKLEESPHFNLIKDNFIYNNYNESRLEHSSYFKLFNHREKYH